jgi:hypothetical protein
MANFHFSSDQILSIASWVSAPKAGQSASIHQKKGQPVAAYFELS